MKEIKCYKSEDGEIFENRKDCIRHEIAVSGLNMYNSMGKTTDVKAAAVVMITDRASAKYFITLCERAGSLDLTEGITSGSLGIFVWSSEEQRYFKIGSESTEALKHIV